MPFALCSTGKNIWGKRNYLGYSTECFREKKIPKEAQPSTWRVARCPFRTSTISFQHLPQPFLMEPACSQIQLLKYRWNMTSYSISYFSALVTSIVIVFFKVMILHPVSFHYVSLSRSESSVGLQKAREFSRVAYLQRMPTLGKVCPHRTATMFWKWFSCGQHFSYVMAETGLCGCSRGSLLTARASLLGEMHSELQDSRYQHRL